MRDNPETTVVELASCIYECQVMHHRKHPKNHRFVYQLFLLGIELNDVQKVTNQLVPLSYNRFNLFSFYDRDHMQPDGRTARKKVLSYCEEHGVSCPEDARVFLITMPRVAGYIFNPVSFYFISNSKSEPICAVAEVSNTFREMKPYILTEHTNGRFRLRVPKHFYVSPFSSLELEFEFDLGIPGSKLDIRIDEYDGDDQVLASSLTGESQPLTTKKLLWFAIKYPLLTIKVMTLIHWHALKLKLKGLEHHRKAEHPNLQNGLVRGEKR